MGVTTIYDLSTPSDYTLINAAIASAIASISPTVTPNTRVSNFGTPSDYTYDNTLIQISANQAKLKDQRPAASTFFVAGDSVNADWTSGGSPTGTASGGAVASAGFLALITANAKITWPVATNFDGLIQTGCIRMTVKPNYSGTPANEQDWFDSSQANANLNNLITLNHGTDGNIHATTFSSSGVQITNISVPFVPVAGTSYEIEFNFDITTGASRLFLNGVQQGATDTNTGARSSNIGFAQMGTNYTTSQHAPNFYVKNFIVFTAVQHTANYTSGQAISSTIYPVSNPTIAFTAQALTVDDDFDQFTSLTGTIVAGGSDAIQFVVSTDGGTTFQYWNGTAWAASSGYAESNPVATISANLMSLTVTDSFLLKGYIHSGDGSTTPNVSNVVLSYDDFTYTSGSLSTNSGFTAQQLLAMTAVISASGGNTVTFALIVNGTKMYWNGSAWAASDGTFAQTNSLATIQANMGTLLSVNSTVRIYAFLASSGNQTTPTLGQMTVTYSFGAIENTPPPTCIVEGFVRDIQSLPVAGAVVTFSLITAIVDGYCEGSDHILLPSSISTTTDANGYFSQPVLVSEFEGSKTSIVITITKAGITMSKGGNNKPLTLDVPNQQSVDITTLLAA